MTVIYVILISQPHLIDIMIPTYMKTEGLITVMCSVTKQVTKTEHRLRPDSTVLL